jgi:outer membrane receptor protein involved in Fe transport
MGCWSVLLLCGAVANAATSTSGDASATNQGIEEIVVTATYRETDLMATPQAISAVTSDVVKNLGAQDMGDIYRFVPGLSMTGSAVGANRYTIRGVSSQVGDAAYALTGSTVGIYLDGAPVTSAFGPGNQLTGNLFDIERVEVLRGPQGTLFGEGSQGGTIRYIYNEPDPSEMNVSVTGSGATMESSDDDSHRVDAMLNVPLIDERLALRIMAFDSKEAGVIDNVNPEEEDYNPTTAQGGRIALRYVGDRSELSANIYHANQETEGGSGTFRAYDADYARLPGHHPFSEDKTTVYNLKGEYDFNWATFSSSTSYVKRDDDATMESTAFAVERLDRAFAPIFNLAEPGAVINDGENLIAFDTFVEKTVKRWVQEFALVSPSEKRLRWTTGFFFKDTKDGYFSTQEPGIAPGREAFGVRFRAVLNNPGNIHEDTLREYAVFGEVSYDLTDTLELTVGTRASWLSQEFENTETETDDNPISPKLVLNWRPTDDLLAYASYTTGFRPGNVNNQMIFIQRTFTQLRDLALANGNAAGAAVFQGQVDLAGGFTFFDGDLLKDYEVGLKTSLWDGRVQLASSVYYLHWDDMIHKGISPQFVTAVNFYNDNSGEAHAQGIELDVTAVVLPNLTLRVAGQFSDSQIDEDPIYEGDDLIYAPDYGWTLGLDYELAISSYGMASLHIDKSWMGSQFTARPDVGVNSAQVAKLPSYRITNARLSFEPTATEAWQMYVALFAKNLTNEEILRDADVNGNFFWDAPRTVGLEVGVNF